MKSLEDYASKSSEREKALTRLNSSLVTLTGTRKRLSKAERALEKVNTEAMTAYEAALAEAEKDFEQKKLEIKRVYDNTVNSAKSAVGVARSEEEKALKAYDLARKRIDKLMPPPSSPDGESPEEESA